MDIYLKRMTPPQDELQAGPSARFPEADIVNIGDGKLSPLKTLQWDKM
jgi:hypothetical protein